MLDEDGGAEGETETDTLGGSPEPVAIATAAGYRTPSPAHRQPSNDALPLAPTSAPAMQDRLLGVLREVLHELRASRAARSPATGNDAALAAMIRANAQQAAALAAAHAQMMQTMLTMVARRRAEAAERPAEPITLALQLIEAVQKLVPTPVAQPGLTEQILAIKALRDLAQPTAPANAARSQTEAARAHTTTPQDLPAWPAPLWPSPALIYVPGIGIVKVVEPEAGAPRFDDMSIEERAAEIRKDPALLRELGIGLSPSTVAPAGAGAAAEPSPASPASPERPAVIASVPAIPAVPDLEPQPVLVLAGASPASSMASAAPSVVAIAPPVPTTIAAVSPVSPAQRAAPSVVAASPVEPPTEASKEEHPVIALPAMPVAEPPHAMDADGLRAVGEQKRLTSPPREADVITLGFGYDEGALVARTGRSRRLMPRPDLRATRRCRSPPSSTMTIARSQALRRGTMAVSPCRSHPRAREAAIGEREPRAAS